MLLSISIISILRGFLGIAVMLGIMWLLSTNRKAISWPLVVKGLLLQFVIALLVLNVEVVKDGVEVISKVFVKVTSFTDYGAEFVLGKWPQQAEITAIDDDGTRSPYYVGFIFAFKVLPTIIFFSALSTVLYYLGVLQRIVWLFAWVMKRLMNLSGAESLAAAGNTFLGQTEAPLLIRPYLERMTRSEIMCLMSGGMATIAGAVLVSYINILGGGDEAEKIEFAKHLLTASLLSAPAAIVAAKILVPETEEFDSTMKIHKEKIGANALEALTNGTSEGLKLAVNVGAMLLAFTAFIYMGNYLLELLGSVTGLNGVIAANTSYETLSFQFLVGYALAPIAWLLGVHSEDVVLVGQLLGEKTILNEFYAYFTLGGLKADGAFVDDKSVIMSTYILCGFANFASIGIQVGGIGVLIPGRKGLLATLGVRALIAGTAASLLTAAIVGMLI